MKEDQSYKELTLEELRKKLVTEQEIYSQLRFAHAVSPIENPMRIRYSRRFIARIGTLIREKELAKDTKKVKRLV